MSIPELSIPPPAGADCLGGLGGRRSYVVAVVAVVAAGLALRLLWLGQNSFWIDVINVLSFVRSGRLFFELRDRGGPFEPPLHYVAVWLALALPVGFETAARVPAAVFGALEVLGLILLTRRVARRRDLAILAGVLLAVAPFAVRYSQENRYYTTFAAVHVLSWWLVVRAGQERRRADFVRWGITAGILLLAHPFAPRVADEHVR